MKIQTSALLESLQLVSAGLSKFGMSEQSTCYAFRRNRIHTFNDDVYCSVPFKCDFEGAIESSGIVTVLSKITDADLSIYWKDDEHFMIKGRRKQLTILGQQEITMPISDIPSPKLDRYKSIPKNFGTAITLLGDCSGSNQQQFITTCLHLTPKGIEATDNRQAGKYSLKLPIDSSFLIRAETARRLPSLNVDLLCVSNAWAHFRNSINGMRISLRRHEDEFLSLDPVLKIPKGAKKCPFPQDLTSAIESATIYADGAKEIAVQIHYSPGKFRIVGKNAVGSFSEYRSVDYQGEPFSFLIAPSLLKNLSNRHSGFLFDGSKIYIRGEGFRYVSCVMEAQK